MAQRSPEQVLKEHFGYDEFRPNQREIVEAILKGRDVLAVMPTGAGKSVCYQVPSVVSQGLTLVISPLISLMKDQVRALGQAGIPAAYLNSALDSRQQQETIQAAAAGGFRLLYVAPERLSAPSFLGLCRDMPPCVVAIDEAHCISQWGQDFRPSYLGINDFIGRLPQRPAVCAFTATATRQVREDIVRVLKLRDPVCMQASFDRPNLHFSTRRATGSSGPRSKDGMLKKVIEKHGGQSGIVYCMTRRTVEEVCDALRSWGVSATRYHGGLGAAERRTNQDDFVFDRAQVMVATNAFGMGIDKSDVGFIVHYNMPLDVESYYQEAGRAGRDGEPADCVLLYAPKDVRTAEFLLSNGYRESGEVDGPTRQELLRRAHERLKQMTFYATTQDCLRRFLLDYFDEEAPGFCGNCSNCETQFEERDVTLEAQKIISCVYRLGQRNRTVGKATIVDILRGSKGAKIRDAGYDTLSTYGIMEQESTRRLRFLLDALLERGLLDTQIVGRGNYKVVVTNSASAHFLKSGEVFRIKVPRETKRERARKRLREGASGPVGTPTNPKARRHSASARVAAPGKRAAEADPQLFQRLKELRASIAAEAGVPAYVVFSDRTLHEMCERLPRNTEEMLEVSGVGRLKAERYAQRFLSVINASR